MDHVKDIQYTMEKIADSYDTNTETLKEFFKLLMDIQSKLLLNDRCVKDIEKNMATLLSIAYEIVNMMKKTPNEELEKYLNTIKEKIYDYKVIIDKVKEDTDEIDNNVESLKIIKLKLDSIEENTNTNKFLDKAIIVLVSFLTLIAGGFTSYKSYQADATNAKMEKIIKEIKEAFENKSIIKGTR